MEKLKNYLSDNKGVITRYSISGFLGALVQITAFYLFFEIAGIWYMSATFCALGVAVIFTFAMHKYWTFTARESQALKKESIYYLISIGLSLTANTLLMFLLVEVVHLQPVLSQTISLGITAVGSFLFNKTMTFGHVTSSQR